ncbi:MAG: hypothetical protein H6551_06135 [Chitinophagales bacterium]|nr:hypothetical protein [Chitinophagaceae bacterium]MCB9064707.1 hypothetical protein [Chitinophagales bacterium]
MKNKVAWFLFAAFLLAYAPSKAQFSTTLNRYRKIDKEERMRVQLHKRLYLGGVYGTHIMSNPLYVRIRDTAYFHDTLAMKKQGGIEIDTFIQTTARLTKTMGGYLGVSLPLAMVTERSAITLDIEANILMGELSHDSIKINKIYKDSLYYEAMPFMMMSGPISVSYRYGGDASLSRDHRTMFSAGAGIAASYITIDTKSGGKQDPLIKAVPFIKAEVGFFFGVAWKLRGTAYLGQYEMVNTKTEAISTDAGFISKRFSGPLGYNVSLMVFPLSFNWDKRILK